MKYLSQEAFQRARHFLKTEARPLDKALFDFRFEEASSEPVIQELTSYQNEDGGFHRLEADLHTPSSSAIATAIGLSTLHEIECAPDHPIVQSAIQFLLNTYDEKTMTWRVVPLDTNSFPHAGWWHEDNGTLARTFHDYYIIPRAKIVALLHHFSKNVPADWLNTVTEQTVSDIIKQPPSDFGDELIYSLQFLEIDDVPNNFKNRLLPLLQDITPSIVERNPNNWHKYCTPPLWVAPLPNSAMAKVLQKDVQAHLDYQIEHQTPSGTWTPFWTWGNEYVAAWEIAKKEWTGHLTLETLTSLQAFGRIEN